MKYHSRGSSGATGGGIIMVYMSTIRSMIYISEVGGVSPSLDRPRTGKSISVAFALRACVRAKLRERDDHFSG